MESCPGKERGEAFLLSAGMKIIRIYELHVLTRLKMEERIEMKGWEMEL